MNRRTSRTELRVGVAEVDITPPVGTLLAGGLEPRASDGIEDPLLVKAMVIEQGDKRIACVALDLIVLPKAIGDRAVNLASERTGIPPSAICWTATHTHTGPYTDKFFGADRPGVIDNRWLRDLPAKFAECVAGADAARRPAKMSRMRAFNVSLGHNRRILFKNGRAINAWNLGNADADVQALACAGPTDPEIGIVAFDRADGTLAALIWQYTLHTNTNFGSRFSGDYPAVVAAKLRERFGPQVVSIYLPGACADINSNAGWERVGGELAGQIIGQLEGRKPVEDPPTVGALKKEVFAEYRDFTNDQELRIAESGWSPEAQKVFRHELAMMRKRGRRGARTVLQAWRVGEVAFASLPGEAFVELGVEIKRCSPFPWTYAVENGGDWQGYLVTAAAWEAGGYESLISRVARPTPQSVGRMVEGAIALLNELHTNPP